MTEPTATLDSLGLDIAPVFVPFSRSRNAGDKRPSLNWEVTVTHKGRPVLTVDYSAGMAHAPSFKRAKPLAPLTRPVLDAIAKECEHGRAVVWRKGEPSAMLLLNRRAPILPDRADVFYALSRDASVADYATFEDWASDLGMDPDSRTAEASYRECLRIYFALRAAVGDDGLAALRTAFEDY